MTQKDRKGKSKTKAPKSDDSAGDYDPLYSSTTDEGKDSVEPEDILEWAEERLLHSAPPTSTSQAPSTRRKGRAVAWVVFCGRKTGVFLTWAATQQQVTGHQGGLQQGYQTVEAANDAWAHGLATQTAYASGELGPTPTRKQRTRKPRTIAVTNIEEITSRAAGLSLSGDEVSLPNASRRGTRTNAQRFLPPPLTNAQQSLPPPSSDFKHSPMPSISTPYPAAYAKKTKLAQSIAGPSVRSQASPSMQTIGDPWWVVVQGSYPGVYHERYQAQAALGVEEPRAIEKVGSFVIANQVFVTKYMQGDVIQNPF